MKSAAPSPSVRTVASSGGARREHQHRHVAPPLLALDALEQLAAVGVGHEDVEQQQVGRRALASSCSSSAAAARRGDHVVAVLLEHPRHALDDRRIVVGDEDARAVGRASEPRRAAAAGDADASRAGGGRRARRAARPTRCCRRSARTTVSPSAAGVTSPSQQRRQRDRAARLRARASCGRAAKRIAPRSAASSTVHHVVAVALVVREAARCRCARPSSPSASPTCSADVHRPARRRARADSLRRARRLDADHARRRREQLDRGRDAGAQPAAAHRHEHVPHVRQVLDDLEAGRALPRDDRRMVVRRHEHAARRRATISSARAIRSRVVVPASSTRAPSRSAPRALRRR